MSSYQTIWIVLPLLCRMFLSNSISMKMDCPDWWVVMLTVFVHQSWHALLTLQTLLAQLYDLFRRAVDKAKRYFIHDVQGVFRQHNVFFRTMCRNVPAQDRSELVECLVIPTGNSEEEVPIMLPDKEGNPMPTHKFINPENKQEEYARLRYRVRGQNGSHFSVDVFDLRFQVGLHEAKVGDSWEKVDSVEKIYKGESMKCWHLRAVVNCHLTLSSAFQSITTASGVRFQQVTLSTFNFSLVSLWTLLTSSSPHL